MKAKYQKGHNHINNPAIIPKRAPRSPKVKGMVKNTSKGQYLGREIVDEHEIENDSKRALSAMRASEEKRLLEGGFSENAQE